MSKQKGAIWAPDRKRCSSLKARRTPAASHPSLPSLSASASFDLVCPSGFVGAGGLFLFSEREAGLLAGSLFLSPALRSPRERRPSSKRGVHSCVDRGEGRRCLLSRRDLESLLGGGLAVASWIGLSLPVLALIGGTEEGSFAFSLALFPSTQIAVVSECFSFFSFSFGRMFSGCHSFAF